MGTLQENSTIIFPDRKYAKLQFCKSSVTKGCKPHKSPYNKYMSPTVFQEGKYRFFFFSREEERMHIHVLSAEGEAKFWIEPTVALANYTGFSKRQLNQMQKIIEKRKNEIVKKWKKHFLS